MQVIKLQPAHIDCILKQFPELPVDPKVYFSPGSFGYCIVENNEPVFAGGIVKLQWRSGEAWILPTTYFRKHIRICFKVLRDMLPMLAKEGKFARVQANCSIMISTSLFRALDFEYEGVMRRFGPNQEDCFLYSRVFN